MHAGIDFKPHPFRFFCQTVTPIQLVGSMQGGPEIEVDAECEVFRAVWPLKHQYRFCDARFPESDRFLGQRDCECVNILFDMRRNRDCAMSVRVCFDDGHYLLVTCCRAHHRGVVQDCAKVNLNTCGSRHQVALKRY